MDKTQQCLTLEQTSDFMFSDLKEARFQKRRKQELHFLLHFRIYLYKKSLR